MHKEFIFREYDIRGRFNIDFDTEFAFQLGVAFSLFCAEHMGEEPKDIKISLGKDARHSSSPLLESLSRGIQSTGGTVYNLDVITSPLSYFSCYEIPQLSGAIMITGSHNPPEYNGFKISLEQNTLTSEELQTLKKYFNQTPSSSHKGQEISYDIKTPYVKRIASEFSFEPLPFAVDCGNGAAGSIAKKTFEACGLSPKILFEEPNGDFPNHHPDPTLEENLIDLKSELQKAPQCFFGVGYDGDCDRIVVVTKEGRTIYSDELMSLFAKHVLLEHPHSPIIGDVKCSSQYFDLLTKWGAQAIMWKTGHSLIKKKVKEEKAPFGGEFSGHIFFNDRFYGFDDALYCTLRLVEILQKNKNLSLDELLSYYLKRHSSPEIRIEVGEEKKHELVQIYKTAISQKAKHIFDLDGVRATFDDGSWALVRVSNTQPAITLRFEASTQEKLKTLINEAEDILKISFTPSS